MEIEKTTAKRLYDESPDWFKNQLVEAFGEECFVKADYETIKTFDDACRACGTTEKEFNKFFEKFDMALDTINYEKLKIVTKAINPKGWMPDWNNSDQRKWWPWFNLSSGSGFGFSYSCYDFAYASTYVGSRLCFESEERSTYAGNQFEDLYMYFLTIK